MNSSMHEKAFKAFNHEFKFHHQHHLPETSTATISQKEEDDHMTIKTKQTATADELSSKDASSAEQTAVSAGLCFSSAMSLE